MPKTKSLRESIVINAGPSRIWSVLTKPEYSRQYYYDLEIRSSWKSGSDLFWDKEEGLTVQQGKIRELVPGMFLEFTSQETQDTGNTAILTRYELQTDEHGIKLSVEQELTVESDVELKHHQQMWRAMLQKIKWLAEYS